MWRYRVLAALILVGGIILGLFSFGVIGAERFSYHLGLDLAGGSHLVFKADVSGIPSDDVEESMEALRQVIERRVNIFGVSEPVVQVEKSSLLAEVPEERLIVELPGVTDIEEAVAAIGETPVLEFKLLREGAAIPSEVTEDTDLSGLFEPTGLTGRYVRRAQLEFGSVGAGQVTNEPIVRVEFTAEGARLFADITRENVGRVLAIFLDGALTSAPVIREEITGGSAVIYGQFTPEEARSLVRNLNFGALPVPIELHSTETIGASLGDQAFEDGIRAGFLGLLAIAIFMIVWYRLPGFIATVALAFYTLAMLALIKLIPVVLTAAGVAGLILSIGVAIDANIIIFERVKEGVRDGKNTLDALRDGFERSWFPIRDANFTGFLSAVVLFWFGTSIIKGFALMLGIGVIVSLATALTVSKILLFALGKYETRGLTRFLFGAGLQ